MPPGAANGGLLFVVEDRGTIRVVDHGHVLPDPFLDISGRVEDTGEQGLLSVAFAPDYATTGLLLRLLHQRRRQQPDQRVQGLADGPDRRAREERPPGDRLPPPRRRQPQRRAAQFGPDGMLWTATGDGGGAGGGDPNENAQNVGSLLGKLIRIDPRQSGSSSYTVPADNPFVGVPGRDEIWAYGFRNPWRFSFDGQRIAIGDVGQNLWEEVDYETVRGAKGANFGWDNYEGNHLFEGPGAHRRRVPGPRVLERPRERQMRGHRGLRRPRPDPDRARRPLRVRRLLRRPAAQLRSRPSTAPSTTPRSAIAVDSAEPRSARAPAGGSTSPRSAGPSTG